MKLRRTYIYRPPGFCVGPPGFGIKSTEISIGLWRKKLTVNLAPTSVRKEGPAYDLPIAVGVLIATNQLDPETVENTLIIGELSLDGGVRHVKGVLPMAALARQEGYQTVIVPQVDAPEAALIPDITVIPAPILNMIYDHLLGLMPHALDKPPDADPHVRWCERVRLTTALYSIDSVRLGLWTHSLLNILVSGVVRCLTNDHNLA